MKCKVCDCDPDVMVILPIKRAGGCLCTITCLDCAEKSDHYCLKHEMPHLGFADDDTTACVKCIEELVAANLAEAEKIYARLIDGLPKEQTRELIEEAEIADSIVGGSAVICLLRFVATKAMRLKKSIDEIVTRVIVEKDIDFILS